MDESKEIEIDLKKLASALWRRWWLLLLAVCVGGGIALAYTYMFVIPEYSATVKLYVNNSTETAASVTSGDITASKSLVETYITIIRSDMILDEVIERTGADYTPQEVNKMLTAGALNATEVFYITITNPYPLKALELASSISDVAPDYLSDIVDGSSVKIVDRAKIPTKPSSPDYRKNTALGALAGLFIVGAILVIMAVFDVRISSEDDLGAVSELPILGVISDFRYADKPEYGYGYAGPAAGPDAERPEKAEGI
ncbi:MAG: hypothetical protein LBT26_01480 [Clostridiales Family XIII bacterium]|jgi:capsular polysaccharide biosynthesis protein|nr:hypothetical protein [Clostridiales Family XIII bacterium]